MDEPPQPAGIPSSFKAGTPGLFQDLEFHEKHFLLAGGPDDPLKRESLYGEFRLLAQEAETILSDGLSLPTTTVDDWLNRIRGAECHASQQDPHGKTIKHVLTASAKHLKAVRVNELRVRRQKEAEGIPLLDVDQLATLAAQFEALREKHFNAPHGGEDFSAIPLEAIGNGEYAPNRDAGTSSESSGATNPIPMDHPLHGAWERLPQEAREGLSRAVMQGWGDVLNFDRAFQEKFAETASLDLLEAYCLGRFDLIASQLVIVSNSPDPTSLHPRYESCLDSLHKKGMYFLTTVLREMRADVRETILSRISLKLSSRKLNWLREAVLWRLQGCPPLSPLDLTGYFDKERIDPIEAAASLDDCVKSVADELDRQRGAVPALPQPVEPEPNENIGRTLTSSGAKERRFRKAGDFWDVVFDGAPATVKHATGMEYIARMLRSPDRSFGCVELSQTGSQFDRLGAEVSAEDQAALSKGFSRQLLQDRAALEQINRELKTLDEKLADAKARHEIERTDDLQSQKDALLTELRKSSGRRGRVRVFPGEDEKARKAVRVAIQRAISMIAKVQPQMAQHLSDRVDTGLDCCYRSDGVVWET